MQMLREFVSDALPAARVPGLAIGIVQDSQVLCAEGFGQRDREALLPATADTLFAIGSCTKAFTTLALGILVDQGKIAWDQPVREILPEFRMRDLFASERLTVRDMVTHRSGLPRHDLVWYGADVSREELVRRLRYLEPSRDLRSFWQYQNLMYAAAGFLTGVVAGCSWEEFVRREILEPLGMLRSNFSVTQSQRDQDFAQPYHDEAGELRRIPFRNLDAVGPAGTINSSVREMTAWVQLQLGDGNAGGRRIVSEATLREMHTPHMPMPDPAKYDEIGYLSYGLGWWISTYRGHLFVQHSGGIDGFTALTTLLPRQKIGVVALSNRGGNVLPRAATWRAVDALLGLEPIDWLARLLAEQQELEQASQQGRASAGARRATGTSPSRPLAEYAGAYVDPGYGTLRISLDGDRLRMQLNGFDAALEHYHYDIFSGYNGMFDIDVKVAFTADLTGRITRAACELEQGVAAIVFERAPELLRLSPERLAAYAGNYMLGPEQATVTLRGDGRLVFALPGLPSAVIEPVAEHEFVARDVPGYSLSFTRDASGAVAEVVVTHPHGALTGRKVA